MEAGIKYKLVPSNINHQTHFNSMVHTSFGTNILITGEKQKANFLPS